MEKERLAEDSAGLDSHRVSSTPETTASRLQHPERRMLTPSFVPVQIDDTVGIMRDNITKVAERGERLDALQDKTGPSPCPRPSPLLFTELILAANERQTTWRCRRKVSEGARTGSGSRCGGRT